MSTQITITLTDDVYQKADRFARLANRDIASILADTIQNSIPNISEAATTLKPISLLSDADVLVFTVKGYYPDCVRGVLEAVGQSVGAFRG
jgi:hypothetical protein